MSTLGNWRFKRVNQVNTIIPRSIAEAAIPIHIPFKPIHRDIHQQKIGRIRFDEMLHRLGGSVRPIPLKVPEHAPSSAIKSWHAARIINLVKGLCGCALMNHKNSVHTMPCAMTVAMAAPFTPHPNFRVSSPRESHPQALSEPDVNLSAHPAPIIQP